MPGRRQVMRPRAKKGLAYPWAVLQQNLARILDGASLARAIREKVRAEAEEIARRGPAPFLRVILVGEDAASVTYVSSKTRAAQEAGCRAETVRLPEAIPPQRLLDEVERANNETDVDGLLVQLPLPRGHDARRVADALDPGKDVDGLHPENVGLLAQGRPRFVPCTAAGILALLEANAIAIEGAEAAVLGRSEIVGKPVAALLTSRSATVTLCHSRTRNLSAVCRRADILVAAIGRPGFVTRDFVQEGAAVVDVGINRLDSLESAPGNLRDSPRLREAIASKGKVLVGDVDFDAVSEVASWITPVPGGVGPLTIAMLLANTVKAARLRRGLTSS
jgi:methylenetetrahydrofolate dehydrogenase (NADP+)/methenyltetrahydrofolate cyclohydrolase